MGNGDPKRAKIYSVILSQLAKIKFKFLQNAVFPGDFSLSLAAK